MPSQTLIFVALPDGYATGKKPRVSVYLAPRLDGAALLSGFPDFVNWPQTVLDVALGFEITCGAKKTIAHIDTSALMPDEWARVFSAQTPVNQYAPPDSTKQLFVSYPVRDSAAFLKHLVQSIGSLGNVAARGNDGRQYGGLLEDLAFGLNGDPSLATIHQNVRAELWRAQQDAAAAGSGGATIDTAIAGLQPTMPPDGLPPSLSPPTNRVDTMKRFSLFHSMPPAPNSPPLPNTPAEFEKLLDFHSGLTALASYPALMRAFGLVFDLELPAGFVPVSPAAGAYGTIAVSAVPTNNPWKVKPVFSFPATSYVANGNTFLAAPSTSADTLSTSPYPAADVIDGFLVLEPDSFQLMQVDLDGALLKTLSLAGNVSNSDPAYQDGTLPSMRTSGIALVANGRGLQLLQSILDNQSFNNALTSPNGYPRPFAAKDLVRGYRLDIFTSRGKKWYSLHRRNSSYELGTGASQVTATVDDEEGFLQTAVASPAPDPTRPPDPPSADNLPQSSDDIYVHERLANWSGWSLSAERPGKALNRSVDPGQALDADPTMNQPVTALKLRTSFKTVPGSLPEFRFGDHCRMRARAVDVAGNSVELSATAPDQVILPADGTLFPCLRFEPVAWPIVVELQAPANGNTLERLVIRSWNTSPSLDSVLSPYSDSRHIAPPRVAERMAEFHGMFDDAQGHLKADAATYKMIVAADGYQIPAVNQTPIDPSPSFNVAYLPDPIARGAALRDLPNTPDNTSGTISHAQLAYAPLPDVQPRPGSVTYIDFGSAWPKRLAFLLTLLEGTGVPAWDATERVLTVYLPKAGDVSVDLSSYVFEQDLDILAVWQWLLEYFEAMSIDAMQNFSASSEVPAVGDLVALITRLVLEGGHPMMTPARTLNFVHAVQQPLGRPAFLQLPVVHNVNDPIFASALRNSFTPITAWRTVGSHYAVLLGGLQVNGASTSKIDLEAQIYEVTDNPSQPAPTSAWNSQHVETISLASLDGNPIYADSSMTRQVGTYIPQVDNLWFSAPFDVLEGVTNGGQVCAPLHRFDDTLHRWVTYTAVATSRFQEFFQEPNLVFTRESDPLVVDVPSSARPAAPEVAYVMPTFGWENQETSNVKSTVRFGNGIRVYLERPWYSSGADEMLGVVLWGANALPTQGSEPQPADRETYKSWFTQWGGDPIWASGSLNSVPGIYDFADAVQTSQTLTIEENLQLKVDVAAFQVAFDQSRNLWYADIVFNQTPNYAPFVRLALARYQSHSITGTELSPVVLADFAQLTPNRSATMIIDPNAPKNARLFVGGLAPEGPTTNTIVVRAETRWAGVQSDAGWVPASPSDVTVTAQNPAAESGAVLWAGTIQFQKNPPPDKFRVVILEYEYIGEARPIRRRGEYFPTPSRIVFAATIPYNFP